MQMSGCEHDLVAAFALDPPSAICHQSINSSSFDLPDTNILCVVELRFTGTSHIVTLLIEMLIHSRDSQAPRTRHVSASCTERPHVPINGNSVLPDMRNSNQSHERMPPPVG